MDRKSFEEGIILALVSPPIPHVVKKQPISYSYNGVILPALPEWDREAYPYAYISLVTGFAVATSEKLTPTANFLAQATTAVQHLYTFIPNADFENETWHDWGIKPAGEKYVLSHNGWANYDIYDTNGEIFVEASEPIPVYE